MLTFMIKQKIVGLFTFNNFLVEVHTLPYHECAKRVSLGLTISHEKEKSLAVRLKK